MSLHTGKQLFFFLFFSFFFFFLSPYTVDTPTYTYTHVNMANSSNMVFVSFLFLFFFWVFVLGIDSKRYDISLQTLTHRREPLLATELPATTIACFTMVQKAHHITEKDKNNNNNTLG
jgi:hypothetical protein